MLVAIFIRNLLLSFTYLGDDCLYLLSFYCVLATVGPIPIGFTNVVLLSFYV